MIRFLSYEDLLRIHDWVLTYTPSEPAGILDSGRLEACVAAAKATFEGEYLHSDVYEMASAYCQAIVLGHPFVSGNKRAGALAPLVFLRKNGLNGAVNENEYYALIQRLIARSATRKDIAEFLRKHYR